MRILIVFESLFGATHAIADEIGTGAGPYGEVTVVAAHDIDPATLPAVDLLVLGAPTHNHGLSTAESRGQAALLAIDTFSGLQLDRGENDSSGMREWLHSAAIPSGTQVAVFDTRIRGPRLFVGSAGHDIAQTLHRFQICLVAKPVSFSVMGNHRLEPGERSRAAHWGTELTTLIRPERA
ncbi:flavodoxin domain-containing protein [Herbiconiux sp. VKM Ac-1786]|uniref:flavodoxin domain-containing protein n=1 Tax=Herbiconiux sp. VKM Ac-1786 TaxID=2783824 RepID=UPI00188D3E35|nr:flavodoxin domain-containing protein [Herbiconiux sp. VKM Ac-1786]MBF4571932.1 flavodoxin domain-containing protein [Herbiconiux sp. VKM Ac-1786]